MNINEVLLTYNETARIISCATLIIFCITTYLISQSQNLRIRNNKIKFQFIFFVIVATTLVVWRAPYLFYPAELNPDESQTLASARIFSEDPIPWHSVDTTTSGPLNSYIYMWTYLFGEHPSYLSKRFTSLMMCLVMLLSLEISASKILGDKRSYLAISPVILLLIFSTGLDFVHASTEYLPVCMLSVATACFIHSCQNKPTWKTSIIIGMTLGFIPFAKLQASFLALSLGIVAVSYTMCVKSWRSKEFFYIILSAILPTILIFSLTLAAGSFDDMMMRSFGQAFL